MYKLVYLLAAISFISCTTRSDIWYHQTLRLQPNESIKIECKKSPADISLRNNSTYSIEIISELKTPKIIKANEIFQYRIPKKGKIIFINSNKEPVLISYTIESSKPFNTTTNK